MRVLFATSRSDDYLSACLWDGFQELLVQDNVSDAGWTPSLHSNGLYAGSLGPSHRVGGERVGRCASYEDGQSYDLLVVNAAMLREHDWHWPINLSNRYLKAKGKVAFIEGNDSAQEWNVPHMPVDAVFRREIYQGHDYSANYGMEPVHLNFCAPSRWLDHTDSTKPRAQRSIDVLCVHGFSHPMRQAIMPWVFRTHRKVEVVAATMQITRVVANQGDPWLDVLRSSKLTICAPGGSGCDCMRYFECTACGSIPIFVGLEPRRREPWFHADCAFFCDRVEDLPAIIERALDSDLDTMRDVLLGHVRKYHTTRARAVTVLNALGMVP